MAEKKFNEDLCEQVRQGKLAIENTENDTSKLKELIAYIFPYDKQVPEGFDVFYLSSYPNVFDWDSCMSLKTMPSRPVSDFFATPPIDTVGMEAEGKEKISFDQIQEAIGKISMPKIQPSGSECFKIDMGAFEITVIKNDIMQDGYAILSPNLFEKLYNHFVTTTPN